jgi:hypothetical protein
MQTMRCHAVAPARAARAQAAKLLAPLRISASPLSPCSSAPQPTAPTAARRAVQCAASTGKFFVGGNWKCNGTHASVEKLVSDLNAAAAAVPGDVDVVVAPPFLFIDWVRANIKAPFQVSGRGVFEHVAGVTARLGNERGARKKSGPRSATVAATAVARRGKRTTPLKQPSKTLKTKTKTSKGLRPKLLAQVRRRLHGRDLRRDAERRGRPLGHHGPQRAPLLVRRVEQVCRREDRACS